jgi:hypothetical protein
MMLPYIKAECKISLKIKHVLFDNQGTDEKILLKIQISESLHFEAFLSPE